MVQRIAPFLLAASLLVTAPFATQASPLAVPKSGEIGQFVAIGSLLCTEAPAQDCIDHGWRFSDRNGDGFLDLEELTALHSGVLAWTAEAQEVMSGRERVILGLARGLLSILPLSRVFTLYDADGDGKLSQKELLVDVQLDERPLSSILLDREATDWNAIYTRLGRSALLLQMLGAPR